MSKVSIAVPAYFVPLESWGKEERAILQQPVSESGGAGKTFWKGKEDEVMIAERRSSDLLMRWGNGETEKEGIFISRLFRVSPSQRFIQFE